MVGALLTQILNRRVNYVIYVSRPAVSVVAYSSTTKPLVGDSTLIVGRSSMEIDKLTLYGAL